jgi:hypothetical protein
VKREGHAVFPEIGNGAGSVRKHFKGEKMPGTEEVLFFTSYSQPASWIYAFNE